MSKQSEALRAAADKLDGRAGDDRSDWDRWSPVS